MLAPDGGNCNWSKLHSADNGFKQCWGDLCCYWGYLTIKPRHVVHGG